MAVVKCPHFCDYDCCLNRGGGMRLASPPRVVQTEPAPIPYWRAAMGPTRLSPTLAEQRVEDKRKKTSARIRRERLMAEFEQWRAKKRNQQSRSA